MVLKNIQVWKEAYIPARIVDREESKEKISYFLEPVLRKGVAHNMLCVGDYGTGKTATIRFSIEQLSIEARKLGINFKPFYFNCGEISRPGKTTTAGKIITGFLREDRIRVYPTLPHEIKIELLKKQIKNYDSVIFILDEVDYYLSQKRNDFETFAYLATRSLPNTSIILITNKFWTHDYLSKKVDARIQDTLTRRLKVISFGDYTEDDLFEILLDRAQIGLEDGCYSKEILQYIAHTTYFSGARARGVIDITKEAALLADKRSDKKLTKIHVDEITNIIPEKETKEIIKKLDPPALNILHYIMENRSSPLERDVLNWFKGKSPKLGLTSASSRTAFYLALSRLKGMDLVVSDIIGRGKGKGKYAILRIPKEVLPLVKDAIDEVLQEAPQK
jgi:cell division control protein 6